MHWMHVLWFTSFWPSLLGNGPEAIIQTVVYGAIAVLFIPPVRRFVVRHVDSLKVHATALHDREKADRAELHRKLDHIILHHPAIPAMPVLPENPGKHVLDPE